MKNIIKHYNRLVAQNLEYQAELSKQALLEKKQEKKKKKGIIVVNYAQNISGSVEISGSKNSFLGLAFAAIALRKRILLKNVPAISDLYVTLEIYEALKIHYQYNVKNNELYLDSTTSISYANIDYKLMQRMRATSYLAGVFISRNRQALVIQPGGCPLDKNGKRKIDFHEEAFKELGGKMNSEDPTQEVKIIDFPAVKGKVHIQKKSVGTTVNAIIASIHTNETVEIHDFAPEPEIDDLINFLVSAGIKITKVVNQVENKLVIEPVNLEEYNKNLELVHSVIPDRIEAISYIVLGLIYNQEITVTDLNCEHIQHLLDIFVANGASFVTTPTSVTIKPVKHKLKSFSFETQVYPGVPTDCQAQLGLLNLHSTGEFKIHENIFTQRYTHVAELRKFGYDIKEVACPDTQDSLCYGNTNDAPKDVIAEDKILEVISTDLRASITLVIAASRRKGMTKIRNPYHLYRGYPDAIIKFRKLGIYIDIID